MPLTVSEDRGLTWTPQNIDPELPQRDTWIDNKWREAMILGHIPQVSNHYHFSPSPAPSILIFLCLLLIAPLVHTYLLPRNSTKSSCLLSDLNSNCWICCTSISSRPEVFPPPRAYMRRRWSFPPRSFRSSEEQGHGDHAVRCLWLKALSTLSAIIHNDLSASFPQGVGIDRALTLPFGVCHLTALLCPSAATH